MNNVLKVLLIPAIIVGLTMFSTSSYGGAGNNIADALDAYDVKYGSTPEQGIVLTTNDDGAVQEVILYGINDTEATLCATFKGVSPEVTLYNGGIFTTYKCH